MIVLYDWRNANHCHVHYHDSLEAAELQAVQLMDNIKHQLPAKAWQRGEWSSPDVMEYIERGAVGSARVYVRIVLDGTPKKCAECSERSTHVIRAGDFCDTHYEAYMNGT